MQFVNKYGRCNSILSVVQKSVRAFYMKTVLSFEVYFNVHSSLKWYFERRGFSDQVALLLGRKMSC